MQIRVDKLRKNLALLQPVVPKKATLPVLTHIRLMDGKMTATDLETRVSIDLNEAQGVAFLLPFKSILDVLKYVPGDDILTLDPNSKGVLKLSWHGGSAAFVVKDVSDYPDSDLKEPRAEGVLNGDMLIAALAEALPYCSTDTARAVLTGVSLYLGNVLQIAGADGFQLSYQSLKLSYPVKETIIIPASTVAILVDLWRKEPGQLGLETTLVRQLTAARQLKLSLWDGAMGVKFGNITVISKLIAGTPPDHLALLGNFQEPIKVRLMAPELYNAVRRLQGIARDGKGIVKLLWTDTQMTVFAHSEEMGDVQADIQVMAGSIPGRIALSVSYLLGYLEGKEGLITMGSTTASGPALFHYGNKPIVAIMPMFVDWGDKQPSSEGPKAETAEENPEPETEEKTPEEPETTEEPADALTPETETKEEIPQEPSTEPVTAGVAAAAEETGKTKPKRRGRRKK